MNTTISILGCGWLGKALAKLLISENFMIKGSTTKIENLIELENLNIIPSIIDIENYSTDYTTFLDSDVLIICITSKNTSAFKHVIKMIEKSNLKKVIFISSTSVYDNTNSEITEKVKTKNTLLTQIEQQFINSSTFNTTIIRFGGLFGYNRQPGNFFKSGKPISNPEGYINFIHRDDCLNIIKRCIKQDVFGHIYNACSDSHPTRREFYTNEFKKIGRPKPIFDETSKNEFKIINSDKLKAELGFTFDYADLMN